MPEQEDVALPSNTCNVTNATFPTFVTEFFRNLRISTKKVHDVVHVNTVDLPHLGYFGAMCLRSVALMRKIQRQNLKVF